MNKNAVILMNMGGARTPDELRLFLKNMFSDKRIIPGVFRYALAPLIAKFRYKKVWKNYREIGGSPIYEITALLSEYLQNYCQQEVTFAMRYTHPYIDEVIHRYDAVTIVPLYPHYSTTTVESVLDAVKETGFKGAIKIIRPFYNHPDYNQIIIDRINKSIDNHRQWHLLFSVHGLPQKIVDNGDIYPQQVQAQINLLKNSLNKFISIDFAYQSKVGPMQWLRPYLDEKLSEYAGKNLLVYPLSFVIDNSETKFELDIEYRKKAFELGVRTYKLVDCPNDSTPFVKFLSGLICPDIKNRN
jgi:ferrochelatase